MKTLNGKLLLTENEFEKLRIHKQNMSLEQINKLKEDYGSKKIINNLDKICDLREFNINKKYNLSKNTNIFEIVHFHSHVIAVYQSLQLSVNDAFTDMYFIEGNYGYYILRKFTSLKNAFIQYQALIDKVNRLSERIKSENKINKKNINLKYTINIGKLGIYKFEVKPRNPNESFERTTLTFQELANNSKHCDDLLTTIQIMLTTNQFLIPNTHKYNENGREIILTEIGSLEHDNSEISYLFYEECLMKLIIATNEVVEFANEQIELLYKDGLD
ncbi:MAG: hypothetical protein V3575_06105 [Candidatus Absconditabacteria bacterium]